MTSVLKCVGVSKSFDGVAAASGIDLNVKRGDVLGIIGANGAGKTTLINMISGYLKPSAGSIHLKGEDVTGMAPRSICKKGVGRSFQIPQLFDSKTVQENVLFALGAAHDDIWQRFSTPARHCNQARSILNEFGIDSYRDTLVSSTPQGVRKLLDIALALCAEPSLVLLDEPTSGVSSEEKIVLMETLWRSFSGTGVTVVFIEHDMELVRQYAGTVAALYAGEVIAHDKPDAVFNNSEVHQKICGTRFGRRNAHHA